MKLLLDTHTFVWWRDDPDKLSRTAYDAVSASENEVFLSVVVAWELHIKIALNKFELKWSLEKSIDVEQAANGFRIIPVELSHVLYLENLPPHHKDPFDRLLISQAIVEDMTLVSSDKRFSDYKVKLLR
ncbi:MAG: type II toxin-antitoxin system VapC family toxin [Acidobacteriota bacterium]|nr:type II toxin-antitoxin system VapC family toxin [Blastocatellia bacterium]MDQ3221666.1 type II toxin-antitoxin system VapC family toxin [Acidobacteriota bacterium]MDQ3489977.1 type II toxin-antitoxin system VapC family toxin [Acidobacteriota bacterium]